MRMFHLIGLAALALPAYGGESVLLANGLRLHADRHEVEGATIRLYADGGVTQLPFASIQAFEIEEQAPVSTAEKVPEPTPVAEAQTLRTPAELAASAARKYALPESFVQSVMRAESGFRPEAISPKGAIGLMQLMPETARTLGVDAKNPKENAEGGAQYLHDLLLKYESEPDQVLLALAAYNAGPGAVERYHGVPPYRETHDYILRVLKNWERPELHK